MPGKDATVCARTVYENEENPEHPANLDLLIQNFDRALSHPDSEDLERLKKSL